MCRFAKSRPLLVSPPIRDKFPVVNTPRKRYNHDCRRIFQARANLLDVMMASVGSSDSSPTSSCGGSVASDSTEDPPDYGHLHRIHKYHRQKKGKVILAKQRWWCPKTVIIDNVIIFNFSNSRKCTVCFLNENVIMTLDKLTVLLLWRVYLSYFLLTVKISVINLFRIVVWINNFSRTSVIFKKAIFSWKTKYIQFYLDILSVCSRILINLTRFLLPTNSM